MKILIIKNLAGDETVAVVADDFDIGVIASVECHTVEEMQSKEEHHAGCRSIFQDVFKLHGFHVNLTPAEQPTE